MYSDPYLELRADLAFRYYRDLGEARSFKEVARYMNTTSDIIRSWADSYDWNNRIDHDNPVMSRLRYSTMQLEQVVREELLKELTFAQNALEKLLFTIFKRDTNDELMLDENGGYVLEDYLKVKNVSDLTSLIKAFKDVNTMKLTAVNGMGTSEEGDLIAQIIAKRDEEKWDIFRTMRECEIVIGRVPDFLKQEATILKAKESKEMGDLNFHITMDGEVEKEVDAIEMPTEEEVKIRVR